MFSLIKKNFLLHNVAAYITIALFLTFFYIATIPPYLLFLMIMLAFVVTTFYYDEKNNVNRFTVSLPVSKGTIVQSKYLFTLFISIVLIIYQSILMLFVPYIFEGSHYIYDWRDMIILISLTMLLSSVVIPIYYSIDSFILTSFLGLSVFIVVSYFLTDELVNVLNMNEVIRLNDLDPGFSLLVEKYIPFQPYMILFIASAIFWYISMKGSKKILQSKDV